MKPRFIDKSTIRKSEIVNDKLMLINKIPIFSIIEFNTSGTCNRSCSFCPISYPEIYKTSKEFLEPELFKKIIMDLASINYSGKILFSAFSEPLLNKNIEILIKIAKDNLPKSKIEMVSNGDLLTTKKLVSLHQAGLDIISVSLYDGEQQIEYFNKILKEAKVPKDMLILRRRYYTEDNYGLTISNRAGLIDSNNFRDKNEDAILELPIKESCYYPFYMILVNYNGDVLLCPHDWNKSISFGNLKSEHIFDIWKNKKLNDLRILLLNKNRKFNPCEKCDVLGTIMGKDSFNRWSEII